MYVSQIMPIISVKLEEKNKGEKKEKSCEWYQYSKTFSHQWKTQKLLGRLDWLILVTALQFQPSCKK